MDRLEEELAHATRFGSEIAAPQNESNTCEWVILPLLWALGYQRYEIASRSYDAAGKLPDYTVLPNTQHTWFLEAKAWTQELSSLHVDQAMNYAHSNGKRWVVLSNGKEWQLYDDSIPGVSADRLVATAKLSEESQIRAFLSAITKESIATGTVDKFARSQRLERVLSKQFFQPDSEVVKVILSTLRSKLGVVATGQDIVEFLSCRKPAVQEVKAEPVAPVQPKSTSSVVQEAPQEKNYQSAADGNTLHLISPVKAEDGRSAEEIIRDLLDRGWYVFADATAGRKRLKPGDRLCFYIGKKGVVAEAQVASFPEIGSVPGVKHPEKYRWRFRIAEVRYFFDRPIALDAPMRRRLEGFVGKDPDSSSWSWYVQGTSIVSAKDFAILTGHAAVS